MYILIDNIDIVYCAAFCSEELNILFLQPTSNFINLCHEKMHLDRNSTSSFIFFNHKFQNIFIHNIIFSEEAISRIVINMNVRENFSKFQNDLYCYFQKIKFVRQESVNIFFQYLIFFNLLFSIILKF